MNYSVARSVHTADWLIAKALQCLIDDSDQTEIKNLLEIHKNKLSNLDKLFLKNVFYLGGNDLPNYLSDFNPGVNNPDFIWHLYRIIYKQQNGNSLSEADLKGTSITLTEFQELCKMLPDNFKFTWGKNNTKNESGTKKNFTTFGKPLIGLALAAIFATLYYYRQGGTFKLPFGYGTK